MTICCEDCKNNHKCGIKCASMRCLDNHCGCAAMEIRPGLYLCNVCKLLICYEDDSFCRYIEEIKQWYNIFYTKNEEYLNNLQKKVLLKNALTETEKQNYEVIKEFCDAKSDFLIGIPDAIQLNTISRRKSAYVLVEVFEKLKRIQL